MKSERLLAAGCAVVLVTACSHSAPTHRSARPVGTPSAVGARFLVDGSPASGSVNLTARSDLRVQFAAQVPPGAVAVTMGDKPVPADSLAWSPDLMSVELPVTGILPYQPVRIGVVAALPVKAPAPLQATMLATVPANSTTGVAAGFRPQTPIAISVENSGPARPQSGLQDADLVYEYLSEYSITRMTAVYFAHVPAQVGPVRSCRMINPYVGFAYVAVTMCSGVSDGTGGWIVG